MGASVARWEDGLDMRRRRCDEGTEVSAVWYKSNPVDARAPIASHETRGPCVNMVMHSMWTHLVKSCFPASDRS